MQSASLRELRTNENSLPVRGGCSHFRRSEPLLETLQVRHEIVDLGVRQLRRLAVQVGALARHDARLERLRAAVVQVRRGASQAEQRRRVQTTVRQEREVVRNLAVE